MSKAHKHADLMIFAAQHWHEAEWRFRPGNGPELPWMRFSEESPTWAKHCEYEVRLIRKPLIQPRREVPAPETEAPPKGSEYWLASTSNKPLEHERPLDWLGTDIEKYWLAAGLVYLNREARDERVRAMLELEGVE